MLFHLLYQRWKRPGFSRVYTLSFLGVMSLFALGNILLKMKRARLPRNVRASWPAVVTGLFSVLVALTGNIFLSPEDLHVFGAYFLVAIGVFGIMFSRVQILKGLLALTGHAVRKAETRNQHISEYITAEIKRINRFETVYFTKGDDLAHLE